MNKAKMLVVGGCLFAFGSFAASAKEPLPEPLIGVASVIDGDTIEVHGTRIRFHGIDAPESRQTCLRAGEPIRCGKDAAFALSDFLGRKTVTCEPMKYDRYKRVIARCVTGKQDIEAWMVSNGHAVAYRKYSMDYVEAEELAKAAKRGVWATEFQMPWDWRKRTR